LQHAGERMCSSECHSGYIYIINAKNGIQPIMHYTLDQNV